MEHDISSFLGGIADGGDVSQINGRGGLGADDDRADVGGVAQKCAGFEQELGVVERARAGLELAIGRLECGRDLSDGEAARGEGGGIELHADRAADTAPPRRAGGRRRGDGESKFTLIHRGSPLTRKAPIIPAWHHAPRAQLQTPVGNNKFDYRDYMCI